MMNMPIIGDKKDKKDKKENLSFSFIDTSPSSSPSPELPDHLLPPLVDRVYVCRKEYRCSKDSQFFIEKNDLVRVLGLAPVSKTWVVVEKVEREEKEGERRKEEGEGGKRMVGFCPFVWLYPKMERKAGEEEGRNKERNDVDGEEELSENERDNGEENGEEKGEENGEEEEWEKYQEELEKVVEEEDLPLPLERDFEIVKPLLGNTLFLRHVGLHSTVKTVKVNTLYLPFHPFHELFTSSFIFL